MHVLISEALSGPRRGKPGTAVLRNFSYTHVTQLNLKCCSAGQLSDPGLLCGKGQRPLLLSNYFIHNHLQHLSPDRIDQDIQWPSASLPLSVPPYPVTPHWAPAIEEVPKDWVSAGSLLWAACWECAMGPWGLCLLPTKRDASEATSHWVEIGVGNEDLCCDLTTPPLSLLHPSPSQPKGADRTLFQILSNSLSCLGPSPMVWQWQTEIIVLHLIWENPRFVSSYLDFWLTEFRKSCLP